MQNGGSSGPGVVREHRACDGGAPHDDLDSAPREPAGLTGSSWVPQPFRPYAPEKGAPREQFAGRGPKYYRRADDRIREDVSDRLTMHPDIDASDLEVRVEKGIVTLRGIVEDRRAKRLTEDIAADVFGVEDVRNELRVRHRFHG